MKFHFVALTLAAALAIPAIAQQPEKQDETPKTTEEKAPAPKAKAATPDKAKVDEKRDKNDARESKLPQSDQEPGVRNPEAKPEAKTDADKKRDADKAKMPQSDQDQAKREGEKREGDKKEVSEHDRSAHYQFKGDAREKLREHYKNVTTTHTRNVTIVRQEVIPVAVQTRIEPVPVEMVGYLGPAPEGFQYGYVDGYVLVYDPSTFFVVDVIDLF
ncbi:hypothetical protein Acid345_2107 [Candidatus Koribacter versatilis Ellin345]|uniref:DUF1236 domain-containing protein n=1 Tax=Koribacter versatilis (strain Ellin345) TaxID=204669 RepID=Q1IPU2_KORVE|nr:hypothetical protein [Candidatus Koribacter versatilis]ABF41108.1 hypothetical protein Acid345_2107 [Candidatus Koribacter versatilis Ellin345]